MTTPAMWTSLHIPVPDLSNVETLSAKTKQRTGVVHEWLRRSDSLPLSISFFGTQIELQSGTEQSNSGLLFKEVLRHSKRWKRMRFEVSGDLVQSIITLSHDQVPHLGVTGHHQASEFSQFAADPVLSTLTASTFPHSGYNFYTRSRNIAAHSSYHPSSLSRKSRTSSNAERVLTAYEL
ncbi:hypothetical protein K443DRAFT_637790 [Laccaria amethystina LaAM-08-1]|jgi:hypothetical protein|uniref:Uncharacterized protein n=1 Tax=Laccaria amethystina LaAM-08-1 TaxID=1095629 RepID=A0A0C9XDI1_9AGAR|nr:hypothetical protein K443DRAFT_637790 [Laccaria amethystina LaAM-08-1]